MTDNQFNQLFDLVTKCVSGIQELKSDVSVLKGDVSVLKSDVSELKSDVSELKSDVSELKSDVSVLKQDVSELKDGQKRIEKEVRLNTASINEIVAEQFRLKIRFDELEKASV